jgi:Raf kinase inhibitor-like YbhB/YbcL family protein
MTIRLWAFLIVLTVPCACGSQPQPNAGQAGTNVTTQTNKGAGKTMDIKITSSAFKEGGSIPKQYTCDGTNISPPLAWDAVPSGVKTLALICDDPDAPSGTWVHWVLYNLPANTKQLAEKVPPEENVAGGGLQGTNDFRKIGYGGPCPPSGTHRYFFKLYGLDSELSLKAGATKADLLRAMEGHIVGQGQLMGTYKR